MALWLNASLTLLSLSQINIVIVGLFVLLTSASTEPPKQNYPPKPLVFKSWPPNRGSAVVKSNGMTLHLRGSPSNNVASRVPRPASMMIKAQTPIRFAIPMRPHKGAPHPAASNHVYYKSGFPQSAQYKRPYSSHLNAAPGGFKFSSPAQKTAIKLQVCYDYF